MKEALTKALVAADERIDRQIDRVLAAAFFRSRPLQAGAVASLDSYRALAARRAREGHRSHFT